MTGQIKVVTQGTHRSCLPQQTFDKVKPLLPLMGVTRIANITGLDNIGISVATACRPNSRAISVAQGKGQSLIAAKVSAAMEAIETYHGEFIDLPLRMASYRMLSQGNEVVDCNRLPRLSVMNWCPDRSMLWLEAKDLTTGQGVYIPYEIVHCDFVTPFPAGSGAFMMSTNGLASGNTVIEATIHSICELIERDATTLWQLKEQSALYNVEAQMQLKVALSSIDDIELVQLLEQFWAADIHVSVWDITSDILIPTFYCTIINRHSGQNQPLYLSSGMGTHPSKAVALSRALTEAAQCRLTWISGSRDDAGDNCYTDVRNEVVHQQNLQHLESVIGLRDYGAISSWQNTFLEQDQQLLLDKLEAVGLSQVLIADLTKAEFDIPVVRVVIPGLEGIGNIPGYLLGERGLAQLAKEGIK
jgi:ribosomal protein S12 methylthiotransferase accessory factor